MNMFKRTAGKWKAEEDKKKQDLNFKNELEELRLTLKLLQEERFKNIKSPKNKAEINISIQLLIFHYLGFLQIEQLNNLNKSALLSVIFATEGSENIRRFLSNVGGKSSPLMKKSNLLYIENLFEEIGLKESLKKVKKDRIRLFPETAE